MNKYADKTGPQATLDFHGRGTLTAEEICEVAGNFVEESKQKGLKRLLIITGKGLHSKGGPVIGPLLMDFLPSLSEVDDVITARRDRGGEGALELQLK